MIRAIKAFIGNVTTRSFTSTTAKYLPIKDCEDSAQCDCPVTAKKVTSYVLKPGKLTPEEGEELYKESRKCSEVRKLKNQWSSYSLAPSAGSLKCRLFGVLERTLFLVKPFGRIKPESSRLNISSGTDLSAFIAEEGKVNLAGEGGEIVGKKSYWGWLLPSLQDRKDKPVKIISLGGAIGFDAEKMAKVFSEEGFTTVEAIVVDPNGLASYLSTLRDKVDHYPMTSQKYFSESFSKEPSDLCVFHLGTTLNVLPEEVGVNVLRELAQNCASGDTVSLLAVDAMQFTTGAEAKKHLEISSSVNEQGFARVIYKENGLHYKTVIKDPVKFEGFMKELGFNGSIETIKSGGVTFFCYKGLKG